MIGVRQREALTLMVERRDGLWWDGCGWVMSTVGQTYQIMRRLELKGLVTRRPRTNVYEITKAGRWAVARNCPTAPDEAGLKEER